MKQHFPRRPPTPALQPRTVKFVFTDPFLPAFAVKPRGNYGLSQRAWTLQCHESQRPSSNNQFRVFFLITVVTRLLTITTATQWEQVLRERDFISAWFQGRVQGTITRYPSSASPTLSGRPTFRLRAGLAQFGPERPLLHLSSTSPTFQLT